MSLPFARVALILAALVAITAVAVAMLRSRVGTVEAPPPAEAPAGDVNEAIAGLEKKLAANPQDANGWHMLGWSYYNVGRYADAAKAYARAAAIEPGNAEHWSALGEVEILSGPGGVIPQAEASFRKALAINPKDYRARYFIGVKKDSDGDHKGAVEDWIAILKDSPADAPWVPPVRDVLTKVAGANKIDLTGRIPAPAPPAAAAPADSVATAGIPGPSPDQLRAASGLTPSQQDDMARTMVARLAARLEAAPRDPDGWIRLMRARMVLGEPDAARAALQRARTIYAADPAQRARFDDAARTLHVPMQ